jgi:putative hydrolase of the HAD superfamily
LKAALFDLYGTLVDVEADEESLRFWEALASDLFQGTCRLTGLRLKELYHDLIHEEGQHKPEGFLLDGVFSKLLSLCGMASSKTNIEVVGEAFRKNSLVALKKKPYTDEVLSKLRERGYLTGLISNTEEALSRYDLKALGLDRSFDEMILSSAFGIKKPEAGIFQEMLARLRIKADEAVFIGNSFDEDIVGALNAGIKAIFLTQSDSKTRSGIEARHDHRVTCAGFSVEDVISALQKTNFSLS